MKMRAPKLQTLRIAKGTLTFADKLTLHTNNGHFEQIGRSVVTHFFDSIRLTSNTRILLLATIDLPLEKGLKTVIIHQYWRALFRTN